MADIVNHRRAAAMSGWAAPILVALLTWAAFAGVVSNGFVNYDDDLYLTANPELARGPGLDGLGWALTTTRGGNWHPVTWVSHLIDARLFGMSAGAHHAVSLALHGVNALLLLALLRGLTGALWPSALAAALFAIHPLHVESVAWAAERKDVLSTLFALCAALAYLRGIRRPARRMSRAAAAALFALALAAKPMPLTLPLLLLLLDWWPLGRWSPFPDTPPRAAAPLGRVLPPTRLWREKIPLLLLAAASGIITWAVQSAAGAMRATSGIAFPARVANAAVAYVGYLRQALWPEDLAFFYPYPWGGHQPLAVGLALLLAAAPAALALRQAGRRPWLAAGLLWYLVSLLPVIGLVQVGEQAMADRYTYLPLVGIFIAVAWALAEIAGRGRRAALAVAAAALAALGLLGAATARQVGAWRDEVTLLSRAIAATEDNYVAHNNLGTALLRRGRAAEALPHFGHTIRLAPGSPKGYQNLGRALAQLGRHEEAVGRFREALARDPTDPLTQRNLGLSLEALARRDEAIAAFREALRLQPRDPATLDALGVALARAGRAGEAVPALEQAAALDPGNAAIRIHLAVARAQPDSGPPPPLTSPRSGKR
jgi:protein O-mannosyl-transferase